MAKISKSTLKWIGAGVALAVAAFIGFRYVQNRKNALPEGIVEGNGRIEAKLVDVSAKEPLRVKDILVDEGAMVKPGQVIAHLDTTTLEAELAAAKATVDQAREREALTRASIVKQKSEVGLANIEEERSSNLVKQGAGSQRELDVRRKDVVTSKASLAQSGAALDAATQGVAAAQAQADAVQSRINDATLKSPVTGRVLYRLAEPGEVLAAGGKAVTLVNLEDIYMEIFLPSQQAANLKIGSEARIVVDYIPNRAVPAYVSFVSPEAQFTPKQVETRSEREKLMFRVKLQLPKEFASQFVDYIKTGVRGVGYVKLRPSAEWPARLQNLVTPPAGGPVTRR
jgi:HlyD family secretion protein